VEPAHLLCRPTENTPASTTDLHLQRRPALCTATSGTNCIHRFARRRRQPTACRRLARGRTYRFLHRRRAGNPQRQRRQGQLRVLGGRWLSYCILPTTQSAAFPLVVDFADFNITSTFVLIDVNPGVVPSGNVCLRLRPEFVYSGDGNAAAASGVGFNGGGSNTGVGIGPINVACTTSHPSYISCFMTRRLPASPRAQPVPAGTGQRGTNGASRRYHLHGCPRCLYPGVGADWLQHFTGADCRNQDGTCLPAVWRPRLLRASPAQTEPGVVDADRHLCGERRDDWLRCNNSTLYTPIPTGNQNVVVTISGTTRSPPSRERLRMAARR